MTDADDVGAKWRAGLQRTLRRLERRERQQRDEPNPALHATRTYNEFKDRLMAAGYVRALGGSDAALRAHLRAAGDAAVEVFRWHGTTVTEIGHLPSMETERLLDDSAINPETFADACYALLASGAVSSLPALAAAAQEAGLFSERAEHGDADAVVLALAQVAAGRSDCWEQAQQALAGATGGEWRWGLEASCLQAIAQRSPPALQQRLAEYSRQFELDCAAAGQPDAPRCLLALPVLGLQALASVRELTAG
jgi:hypothetical protein